MTYAEWAERHLALFGLTGQGHESSALEWAEHFRAEGVTPGELWDASRWLAANASLHWPADHLPALRDRVAQARRETLARAAEFGGDGEGVCRDCGGSGWAIVPRPPSMGGSQTCRTFAVTCVCWKGRNRHATLTAKPLPSMKGPPLSLEEYRRRFPS